MLRRPGRLIAVLAVATALLLGALGPAELAGPVWPVASSRGPRPNVVLIVTDDQRADTLASMPRTNRLLVDKGVTFDNGMVPTNLCCPSRASILTGLFSHTTRVYGNGDVGGSRFGGWAQFHRRGLEYRTIATALNRRGYRTGFFGKYLNDFSKMSPDGYTPPGWDNFTAFKYSRGAYFGYRLTDGSYHGTRKRDYSTDVLARRATRFVRRTPGRQPVFVMFAPYGPHSPYVPAPRDAGQVKPVPAAQLPAALRAVRQRPEADTLPRWMRRRQTNAATQQAVRSGQTAALLAVDDAVASLVRTMRRQGRVRNTMFVFLSDNGYLWGEHGMVGKDNAYDGGIRIPMVLRWDGHVRRGTVDDRLALNVDVAGTIADATGARMQTEGLDLLGARTRRGFPVEAMAGYRGRPAYCGWRTKRYLYVRYDTGRTELYDYATDPFEQRNLAGDPSVEAVQTRLRTRAARQCRPEPPGFDW